MSPQWAPGLIALFAMNLRSRQVHRSLEFCYQVWSPRSHVGLLLFILIQNSILSSTFIGAGAYCGYRTLMGWKTETDKYERTV